MNDFQIGLAHAALGRRVFPWKPITKPGKTKPDKTPLVKWQDEATTDEATIIAWEKRYPGARYGWRLDEGLAVVDVDDRAIFDASGLDLPDAPEQRGTFARPAGLHRLYAVPDGRQTQGELPGADTRVGGLGWVALYSADAFAGDPPPAPAWFPRETRNGNHAATNGGAADTWPIVVGGPFVAREALAGGSLFIPAGKRDGSLASIAGTLISAGASVEATTMALGLIDAAGGIEQPAGDEIRDFGRIAASVARTDAKHRQADEQAMVDDLPETWTVRQLAEMPSADDEYIVGDGLLTRGGKMLIYAKSGAGKTTLLDFLAGPLATGRPFLGHYPVDAARRVLVVQGELSQPEMTSHAQTLLGAGFDDDNLRFARMTNLKLPTGRDRLRALIEREEARIVALDPWYRLFAGESSDKPEQVGVLFDVCDELLDDGLVDAVIVVHHANVSGIRTAGSWVFEGWPSTILRLEAVPGVAGFRKLTFEKIRAPSSTLNGTSETITLRDAGYQLVAPAADPLGAGEIIALSLVREAAGSIRRKDLIQQLMGRAQCRSRAANKYLAAAVQNGLLRSVRDGAESVYQLGPKAVGDEE